MVAGAQDLYLKDLFKDGELLVVPGAHDPLAARLAEMAGFAAVFVGGSAVTNSRLGLPDHEFLSLSDMATVCASIRETSRVLPIVDADTGYGDDINVRRAIRVLEAAGAAAVVIEDQVSPKRSGHVAGKQIVVASEMCRKIEAATQGRSDDSTLIIARTDARLVEGLESAIERANDYRLAGADIIFVESPLSIEEMTQITDAVPCIHLINMGGSGRQRTTPKLAFDELRKCRYQLAIFALQPLRAAALGTWSFLHQLADNGIEADRALLEQLSGTPLEDWYEFTGLLDLIDPANR
jgi:2-methylisocitrate lyase-like PEP mutase family enzyme